MRRHVRGWLGLGLAGLLCWAAGSPPARARDAAEARRPVRVMATIFPLYDWARIVGGEDVVVEQILPPGVEVHSFAPRPSHLRRLRQADVILYLGADLEPWLPVLARDLREATLVVEVGASIQRSAGRCCAAHQHEAEHHHNHTHGDSEGHHAHTHDHGDTDPHLWLDPVLAMEMVTVIGEALGQANPPGADGYRERAAAYGRRLQVLHEHIQEGLARCRDRTLVYGGHFAFGYFARRYDIEHVSPYPGFAPDAVPSPGHIARTIEILRASGQQVVFHEALLEPKVARVIAAETGARLEVLHTLHNLTRDEWQRRDSVSYIGLMEDNFERLRAAWDCP